MVILNNAFKDGYLVQFMTPCVEHTIQVESYYWILLQLQNDVTNEIFPHCKYGQIISARWWPY